MVDAGYEMQTNEFKKDKTSESQLVLPATTHGSPNSGLKATLQRLIGALFTSHACSHRKIGIRRGICVPQSRVDLDHEPEVLSTKM